MNALAWYFIFCGVMLVLCGAVILLQERRFREPPEPRYVREIREILEAQPWAR